MKVQFEIEVKILEFDNNDNPLGTGIGTKLEGMPIHVEKSLEELKDIITESIGKALFDIQFLQSK